MLGAVRKAKSQQKRSMKAEVDRLVVRGSDAELALLRRAETDLRNAGVVREVVFEQGDADVEVTLAPEPAA